MAANEYLIVFLAQMKVMLKKNLILQKRYWRSTLAQVLLGPVIFLAILAILQAATNAKSSASNYNPSSYTLEPLSACQGRLPSSPCITIMYEPFTPATNKIMSIFAAQNSARGGPNLTPETSLWTSGAAPLTSHGIIPVTDSSFIYSYTMNNLNSTLFGISFTLGNVNLITNAAAYQVWYNYSVLTNTTTSDFFGRPLLSLMRGLDEAIYSYYNDSTGSSSVTFDLTLQDWPKIPPSSLPQTMVQELGPGFFFAACMVLFINVLNTIVGEKELHLRRGMEMMGLKSSVYWISTYISFLYLAILSSLVTVVFGFIYGFSYFTQSNFFVTFFQFFLFNNSLIALGMFLSVFCFTTKVAVLLTVFVFVIGLMFQTVIFSGSYLGYIWFSVLVSDVAWKILILLPFFNFGKIFVDIGLFTAGKYDFLTSSNIPGPGFFWSSLYQKIDNSYLTPYDSQGHYPDVPVTGDSFNYLVMNFFFYATLTWYFDKVWPDDYGQRLPVYFFVLPSYWGFNDLTTKKSSRNTDLEDFSTYFKDESPEVNEERKLVYELERTQNNDPSSVRIVNLRKAFQKYFFKKSATDKVAVNRLCLSLQKGKLLALLGQNGAGKSTTMNILAGLTSATDGDAYILNHSVRTQMTEIRKNLGVCPQHDMLYNDLSAREHLSIYGAIKGLSDAEIDKITTERLAHVRLDKVADKFAGTYSGGMKRRLSVIISTIGDPKVLFMDEPTTGMDPVNRRHVWTFLEKFKKDRIIILTTHSMEEADVLGDRIAVMAHGRLWGLGNSVQLKNRYGSGYRISLNTLSVNSEKTKENLQRLFSDLILEDESAGSMIYRLPAEHLSLIPKIVQFLEGDSSESKLITAWGISQTTLEEVFLHLIHKANPKGYSGYAVQQ